MFYCFLAQNYEWRKKLNKKITTLMILALLLIAGSAYADVTISVLPSLAPNAFGSPNWNQYVTNATYAIQNGLSSYGDPNSPSYYSVVTTPITYSQMIVTGFPSWDGQVDPGSVYGPAYANEYGNRGHFGMLANGNGTKISASELSFFGFSVANPVLNFLFLPGSYNYSTDLVGIINGPGGPTYVTSGPNTQLVDELVFRGSGNADAAYCSGCTLAQQQAAIDAALQDYAGMTKFVGTYTLATSNGLPLATGSGEFDFRPAETAPVPEPGSWALLATAAGGAVLSIRKRRKEVRQQQ